MNTFTVNRLLDLNRQFYQTFAHHFSATRQRLQPGVLRVLDMIPQQARILDLGCGNGELWLELARRDHSGAYTGLDSSRELLAIARSRAEMRLEANQNPENTARSEGPIFLPADLAAPGWEGALPGPGYDFILAFAVLHHLPGELLRRSVMGKVHSLLAPGGRFIHSEWQFLNSRRLKERLQSWTVAGLDATRVDPGDYLLDWRHGGHGLRYVHHFSPEELAGLAVASKFQILETFYSDGESGNMGLYQVWEPIEII